MKKIILESFSLILIVLICGLIGHACKKNRFKKQTFLTDLYTYKIEPEIKTATTQAAELETTWSAYIENTTATNYQKVQNTFLTLADQLERVNFYNLGDVGAVYVFSRFYKTKVDTVGISTFYESKESFTKSDIASNVNTQKGVFALEYLLFSAAYQDIVSTPKFLNFIAAQLAYLTSSVEEYENSWKIYKTNFTASEKEGVNDPYNSVINRIIHVFEDIINKRIAKPLAAEDSSLGVGFYANRTLKAIKIQLQQLNAIYLGEGTTKFNSVYNNVRKKKKRLADEISTKFEETIAFGQKMTEEMAYYLENDQPTLVSFKKQLTELLTYFKVDVQAELDIILTFGDTDGD